MTGASRSANRQGEEQHKHTERGMPGQPLLNRHQVGGVSRSPDGLFEQQEREPIRARGKLACARGGGGVVGAPRRRGGGLAMGLL